MSDHEKLDAAIAAISGLEYVAEFVPQSKSRNAGEKHRSLNWRLTLKRDHWSLTTDYMQGSGHVPGFSKILARSGGRMTIYADDLLRAATERGVIPRENSFATGTKLPAPLLRDVLCSLISDASAIDAGSFEDWASDYGYDADSRSAEAIYRQCVDHGLKLRRMLGDAKVAELRELFSDY